MASSKQLAFGSFVKTSLFQVYDKDTLDHYVKLTNKASNGVAVEACAVWEQKKNPRGFLKTAFTARGAKVDTNLSSTPDKNSTASAKWTDVLPKQLPGLHAGIALSSIEKDFKSKPQYGFFTTVNAEYIRPNVALTASLTTDAAKLARVSASATAGLDGVTVGGDVVMVKNGDAAFEAKSYNVGAGYTKGDYAVVVQSDAKFAKLKAHVIARRLGKQKNFVLGAQAKLDLQASSAHSAPQREIIASVEQVATQRTTYRLAVVSNGDILGAVTHKFANPNIALDAALVTRVPQSSFAPWPITKFGVGLTFGTQ